MAELKRLFVGSKMDKDSDKRFVSNGDYTDAVNVEIINSEGGDSGIVRSKLGTTRKANKSFNNSQSTFTEWNEGSGDTAPFGYDITTATCVGIQKHTPTNTIYLFITATGVDLIMEYDENTDLIAPILVDVNGVLNFDANKAITGISILEGTLGWVQEDIEPKAFVISEFKEGSVDFQTQTQYKGGDFVVTDVTMMKLAPLAAPTMSMSNTLREGVIETTTQKNLTIAGLNNHSISPAIPNGTSITLTIVSGTAFVIGDKIKLTTQANNTDDLEANYEVNLVITNTSTGASILTATIISATADIEDFILTWELVLVQAKPLFELIFPRFGYRWKYDNNQYSTFSPFTQAAFLPENFLYNSQKGYNVGMTNNVRKITLNIFDTPPSGVNKLDILYKESNSSSVYVVDTIDATETTYEITNELIWKLVESTQLLRPWDTVPNSALALEVVANRFLLGNYKKNFNVPDNVIFSKVLVDSIGITEIGVPVQSIKSLRTYQAGVIFKGPLGRETPVFTSKTGVVKTTLEDASTVNKLQFQLQGTPPEFATHFKYFIKDVSNEYYNLAADRIYQSEDRLATWVSFPSSERNKVTVDSYLIAKKLHDKDQAVTDLDNKFKIVDIQSEAPSEISSNKEQILEAKIFFDSNFGDGNKQSNKNVGSTPTPGSKVFLIAGDGNNASDGVTGGLLKTLVAGNYIKFSSGATSSSKFYKISSILQDRATNGKEGLETTNVNLKVHITESFTEDINFLYTTPGSDTSPLVNDKVTLTIHEQQEVADQEQFTGRFFIKLTSNAVLNNIFASEADYIVLNAATAYDGGYISGDINFKIHAGGAQPRLGYTVANTSGGLNIARNPSYADDDVNDPPYNIVFEKRHKEPLDNSFIAAINTVGTQIRFSNHSTIYTITKTTAQTVYYKNYDYTRYWTLFDKQLTTDVTPFLTTDDVIVEIVGVENIAAFTSSNPAIFETEPAEAIDLNLYYEASDAFPIAEYNDLKTLDYYNCFTFGNGVESNRIRDDFNAVFIDKGPKVSSVLDEPYGEEHTPNGMIWSGIFNSNSGTNNLNQFIIAEPITKEVNPIYGSIQRLHARDTDMVVLCEDKILQLLASKDALYNADGSVNITASNAVLGDARPFVGEFGISTDPASFVSYGFRAYFTDKRRGVPIRLSRDGITPITKGYKNEFEINFKTATNIIGSYDDETGKYNITMNGETVQFSETSIGWTSRWELNPDAAITLNNTFYSSKNGILWAHDNKTNRNSWYGESAVDSTITFVFNDEPSLIKTFKTLSYEGDEGWIADEIETDQQSGRVLTWKEKEGKFYNYIKGLATDWDNVLQSGTLDTKEFSVQGIGDLISISGDVAQQSYTINIFDDPSDH